jgi:peptide/nickel transport system substrate-binding protein
MRRGYLEEAHERYWELWCKAMAAQLSRRITLRAGTLASLGGVSAINALLAACAAGAREGVGTEYVAEAGRYQYSRFPLVEKYHFKRLPLGGTPYYGGTIQRSGGGASSWNKFRTVTYSGYIFSLLAHIPYGEGADMHATTGPYWGLELEPDLAEWRHAPDFSYYDWHLVRGARFHNIPPVNGREVTADDVKYSIDKFRLDSIHNAALDVIERIEVLDRYTVRMYLKRPIAFLPAILAAVYYEIVAPEHVENEELFRTMPIGTGPFEVVSDRFRDKREAKRHQWLRKDPRWPGVQLPFLDKYLGIYFADAAASSAAYRTGQIDAIAFAGDRVAMDDLLSTNPDSVVHVTPNAPACHVWYLFQHNNPVFQDVRVRRALSMAVDRKVFGDTVFGGAYVGSHPISWSFLGRDDAFTTEELGPYWQYNPTEARRLLEEAGYRDGLDIEVLASSVSDSLTLLKEQWERVGVRLNIRTQESTVVTNAYVNKTFPGIIAPTCVTTFDPGQQAVMLFDPKSGINWGNVNDPVMTDMAWRLFYELDPDRRTQMTKEIHQRTLDQVYHLWIVSYHRITMSHPWLHNWSDHIFAWYYGWGDWQVGINWLDERTPGGRGGRKMA